DGHITLPGFYDQVRELGPEERADLERGAMSEAEWLKTAGVGELAGEKGFTTSERLGARPTLEVNGLLSGFTGEGAKTVLPAVAMAKISMRLVPDQDPDKMANLFQAYVEKIAPKAVELKVTRMHGGRPWMTSFDHPFVK